jgi:hypothetical protein
MSESGFFCDQCLQITRVDAFFDQSSKCDLCLSGNEELDSFYDKLLVHDMCVYNQAKTLESGETFVMVNLYNSARGTFKMDDESDESEYDSDEDFCETCRNCMLPGMRLFYGVRKTETILRRFDFNLNVWKTPVLEGLTRNLCQPLAALAKSNVITVTVAKVILLMIGSCLRDKTEIIRLFDLVVYDNSPQLVIKY